ncbi:hypothetical protein KUTeg_002625 [Tegillarca granosa]|uniref:Ig-like domain-containing protein n=1 Tax=Tegillarca granosa TaxID=220873 RepID=A0ABQ9FUW6_TEGGR|nr:hypothetical protein KUTeg_002625 [Tegillarca granosa]
MPEKTRISIGGCKRFECQVIGYPRPTIQWFKDGDNITNNKRYKFDYCEEGVITMTIEDVTNEDQGCYQCRADNCVGWAATAAYLHIRGLCIIKKEQITINEINPESSNSVLLPISNPDRSIADVNFNDCHHRFKLKAKLSRHKISAQSRLYNILSGIGTMTTSLTPRHFRSAASIGAGNTFLIP